MTRHRLHSSSINSVRCKNIPIEVPDDPATIATIQAAVVTTGMAPTGPDWRAAFITATRLADTNKWEIDVRTHTIGASPAQQVVTAGIYKVWLHLADPAWLDDMRFLVEDDDIEIWT